MLRQHGSEIPLPLPLHARQWLNQLPKLPDADAAVRTLEPLLQQLAGITRWRRAAIVAGCLAGPILHMFLMILGTVMLQHWSRANPGVMELSALLREHATANSRWMKNQPHPTDRQFAIYIAAHYRNLVTNEAAWTSPLNMTLVKGDARKFAEQSVAQFPAPTKAEVSEADAALKKTASQPPVIDFLNNPRFLFFAGVGTIVIYVCLPALIAALAFRGGLVLLIARVTFVKKNGDRASRLRLFWRTLVAWAPALAATVAGVILNAHYGTGPAVIICSLIVGGLTLLSLALPNRGLQDRLAGTWPVPR